jgi:hypothetical protein
MTMSRLIIAVNVIVYASAIVVAYLDLFIWRP